MSNAPMAGGEVQILTAQQLANMPQLARDQYLAQLRVTNAPRAAQLSNQEKAFRTSLGRTFMQYTLQKESIAMPLSGQGLTQAWANSTTFNWGIPTAQNGFLESISLRLNLTVTPTAGTSAVYGLTAGAPYSLIDTISINYGGTLHYIRPYWLKYMAQFAGYQRSTSPFTVLSGVNNTTIASYFNTGTPVSAGVGNVWTFDIDIPLNAFGINDARGMLPIMGGETNAQISVTTAANLFGVDPVYNTLYAVSGTGHAVPAPTGTLQVIAQYRDGTSLSRNRPYVLDLAGLPVPQMRVEPNLTGIVSGQIFRQPISVKRAPIQWLFLNVIDGNASNKFSTLSNIQRLEIGRDPTGANLFNAWGQNTNLSFLRFFRQLRNQIGQYWDEGILPIVTAPIYGIQNADNMTGVHALNTAQWPDFQYGLQLGSIGAVTGIVPRVEAFAVYQNNTGLTAS